TGGIGLAASGCINPQRQFPSMFEPVHGSAPDIAGKGVANPCALLLGAAQMLEHIGMVDVAARLRAAIVATLEAKDSLTPDLGGTGTTMGFAKAIASRVAA
ncbi:MAG: NAD-dependent isocitrate dehydrogenase, partial [Gammaproteobacteria bacterium]|nr:NAD-dependent isocitrate dehydrogenase [Gammaproteobacteria bacterium]